MLIEGNTEHRVRVAREGLGVTHENSTYADGIALDFALAQKSRIFDGVVHTVLVLVHPVVLFPNYALPTKATRTGILSPLNEVICVHHNKVYIITLAKRGNPCRPNSQRLPHRPLRLIPSLQHDSSPASKPLMTSSMSLSTLLGKTSSDYLYPPSFDLDCSTDERNTVANDDSHCREEQWNCNYGLFDKTTMQRVGFTPYPFLVKVVIKCSGNRCPSTMASSLKLRT